MSQSSSSLYEAPVNNRGSRLVYAGSVQHVLGYGVRSVDDCECGEGWGNCAALEPWDPARRLVVVLADGTRLDHVRSSSLYAPRH